MFNLIGGFVSGAMCMGSVVSMIQGGFSFASVVVLTLGALLFGMYVGGGVIE